MIDLHSHILPELDDGASDLNESLEMAALAAQSGVTDIVATPHCDTDRAKEVHEAVKLLREALFETDIPIRLYTGMEIFGTQDTVRLLKEGKLYTLNHSRYPLIEFSFDSDGEEESYILKDVIKAGYTPLVAHPERYRFVQHDPEILNLWARMGCLFQINRGSLLGRFGSAEQELAYALVGRSFATVVASDAHSVHMRTPWMWDVYEQLKQEFSPAAADYLLNRNPKSILKNEKITPAGPDWF